MGKSIFRHEFDNGDVITVFDDGNIDFRIIAVKQKFHTVCLGECFNLNRLVKTRQKSFFTSENIKSFKDSLDDDHPCPEDLETQL